jgi:hypothetical protein
MKIVRESLGGYPPGAEHDPRAPWNETDQIEDFIRLNVYGEVEVVHRRQLDEDEWEEDAKTIDPYDMDKFLAQKLRLDFQRLDDEGKSIEIEEIRNLGGGRYEIYTEIGRIRTSLSEIEDLL